jgi:hypothetical protein
MLQTSRRNVFKLLAVVAGGIILSGSTAAREQTVFASLDFASCAMDLACPPLPDCEASDFNLFGFCSASCIVGDGIPFCSGFSAANATQDAWQLDALFAAFIFPGGDTPDVQASFSVTGTRPAPDQLDLNGSVALYIGFEIPFEPGEIEVSVFRFSGDPTVFEGIQVSSVFALVALGLIDAEDVLLSEVLAFPGPADNSVPFSFTVDVSGVPSDEIVVFGSHSGSVIDVPVLSEWGVVLLALAILLAATWMLRRSQSCDERIG